MRIIACIEDPVATHEILGNLKPRDEICEHAPVTRKPGTVWTAIRPKSSPSFNPGCGYLEGQAGYWLWARQK